PRERGQSGKRMAIFAPLLWTSTPFLRPHSRGSTGLPSSVRYQVARGMLASGEMEWKGGPEAAPRGSAAVVHEHVERARLVVAAVSNRDLHAIAAQGNAVAHRLTAVIGRGSAVGAVRRRAGPDDGRGVHVG